MILSVACHRHLHSVTHYYIVNLAVADLLLTSTVLPFSAIFEILGYWAFGRVFCNVWAAVDVLCCTASIMGLCIISIDRYIGVSYPLRYPTIVTQKRGLMALLCVWALSLVISIGPLFGWRQPAPAPRLAQQSLSGSPGREFERRAESRKCPKKHLCDCELSRVKSLPFLILWCWPYACILGASSGLQRPGPGVTLVR